jgi:predicted ATPase/signal transduction histidine kinase/GAF domain-containing protein
LAIAIQLANILDGLSRHRIIHKDIKPANILIHPESKQIKLIDFGIASLLPKETEEVKHPNVLEGTLGYLAPEQTGRMNRGIDYRTDFYALGVTLFELLTGQLPFQSDDSLELVHCHLAKSAPSVCEFKPEIPTTIAQIVTKLMAKNAEDRYQSALGLKYDLEIALHQFSAIGTIAPFVIATQDISDRFTIPEKLYGRELEIQKLLNAFDRVSQGSTELMLVAGVSGIGKTAVVNEVHKPIAQKRGYIIKGKFDQFNRNIPFSAFVQAFRDLMGQLLSESDAQLTAWKNRILEVVGENGQVIIAAIPELERIIGYQPPLPELSGSAAQNRFNLLFQKFIQVFTTLDHPLVMFLDDLQWADLASLKLLRLLMQDTGYLLMLGAYRDNEVSPVHPFMLTVAEIVKVGATVNAITLQPLSQAEMNRLVADTLICDLPCAQPLTELVYQKTKGNPFFSTRFLKALYEEKNITFNWDVRHWQCDIAQARLTYADDVVEFMARQLQKLPMETQDALKLAACIGAQVDLNMLAIVFQKSPQNTAQALQQALQEGLIIPSTEVYKLFSQSDANSILQSDTNITYKFLHDRVQQAAYSLILDDRKQATHYYIGQLLLKQIPSELREDRIFDLVNQLNYGSSLITQQTERDELAQLNLLAGRKAKAATAYTSALEYAIAGIKLLSPDSWRDCYQLTLQLHEIATEAAYLTGNFSQMANWVKIVMQQTGTILDRIEVIEVTIQSYAAQNRYLEAIVLALDTLEQLGVSLPKSPIPQEIQMEFIQTREVVSKYSLDELLNLPNMSDPYKLAASQILANISGVTSIAAPSLLPISILFHVQLLVEYGNSPFSAHGYIGYGVLASLTLKDSQTAYEFGQLALQLIERSQTKVVNTKIFQLVGAYTIHWKRHVSETLLFFDRAFASSLEDGDLEFFGYATMTKCQHLYFLGRELTELDREMAAYNDSLAKLKQEAALSWNQVFRQAVLNLIYPSNCPCDLTGDLLKEDEFLEKHILANDKLGLHYFYSHKLILCNLFGEYGQGLENSRQAQLYLDAADGFLNIPVFRFHDSLVRLQNWMVIADAQRMEFLEAIDDNQQIMHLWAENAPMNYQHKFDLVEAERHRVSGNKAEAIEFYDRAIAGAKANGYVQEEALANELAAKFYLEWGKEKIAQAYMTEAYYCYARWGATAKVTDLENRYPQLLVPILQTEKSADFSKATSSQSSSRNSEVLDLSALLKASHAISEEIELNKLLVTLLNITIANAGADKCVLLLQEEREMRIVALVESGQHPQILSPPVPLELSQDVAIGLVNTVKHSLEPLVLVDARENPQFAGDRYIIQHQPQSVLCIPILKQGQLLGILYLENNLTVGAFTSDRIEVLNLLCTQAAISIEHARLLYESRQSAIDLQQSNAFLQAQRESSPDGILVIDGNRRVSSYNQGFAKIWHIPQSILDTKDDYQLLGSVLDRLEQPDEFLTKVEYLYQHPDETSVDEINLKGGRILERASTIVKLPSGEFCGRIWCFRDISDRKAVEAQLQHQAQQLEEYSQTLEQRVEERTQELSQVLANLQAAQTELIQSEKMAALGQLTASVAHEINTPLGVIRGATSNIVAAFSASLQQLPDLLQRLSPPQQAEFLALVNSAIKTPQALSTKEERQLQRQMQAELSAQGIPGAASIATQLTLLRVGLELHPYQSLLRDPNCLELLKVAYNLVVQKHSTHNIQQEVDRAAKIVFALKTYSHHSENAEKTLVPITDSIEVALTLYQNRLKHGINTICHYAEVPEIFCNQDELTQVWVNLIDNAIYAMSQQGTLEIDVTQRADRVVVEVTDSGSGIPVELQPRIFEPFFTSKPRGEGSGLGLDIVRQIVQKHHGEIRVRSQRGRTTFTVCLPLPTSA